MKNPNQKNLFILFILLPLSFLSIELNAQQWNGSGNTGNDIYREGNVGIGEAMTNPSYPLDIKAYFDKPAAIRLRTVSETANTTTFGSGIDLAVAHNDGYFSRAATKYDAVIRGLPQIRPVAGGSPDYNNMIISNITMGDLIFTTKFNTGRETARMRLHPNGQLVIGENVTAVGNFKLFVEQGILTEEVKVALRNSSEWGDYVFAKDYQLPTLTEVEKHINTYQHLPNVPSAKTLAEDGGIKLKEMTITQQEKIEELFLYVIEMNKKIEALEKENEMLKKQIK